MFGRCYAFHLIPWSSTQSYFSLYNLGPEFERQKLWSGMSLTQEAPGNRTRYRNIRRFVTKSAANLILYTYQGIHDWRNQGKYVFCALNIKDF